MKKTKENLKNNNFTKLTRSGISLIVLVITIIVIIILAAAIIISLNNNNPIMEANTAKYESDRANMQAVFTNAVAKVMAKNQATLTISAGQINTVTGGVSETTGEVAYTLTDAQNVVNSTGKIVFDKKDNTDTIFYTGKQLPIYAAGNTIWYVDDEGNISLEVGGTKYGSGEIIKPVTGVLSELYEDLAGDETGAIKGKLHIGDYVDYNPIASGVTEKTEENGYVYISQNDKTGINEALASGQSQYSNLSTVTGQKFTTQENLKWRVLGIKGDNLLIITEDVIKPDIPLEVLGGSTGYFMYGAKAYVNVLSELANISKIYGNGELADDTMAISMEHINKIAGVTVTDTEILPSGVEKTTNMMWCAYGTEYSFNSESGAGWTPETWLNKDVNPTAPGIGGKTNTYVYKLTDEPLKTASSQIRYSLIDYGNKYYLASKGILMTKLDSSRVSFGLGFVSNKYVYSASAYFGSIGGGNTASAMGIRPVVKLNANVIGKLLKTDDTGLSTWHIELE